MKRQTAIMTQHKGVSMEKLEIQLSNADIFDAIKEGVKEAVYEAFCDSIEKGSKYNDHNILSVTYEAIRDAHKELIEYPTEKQILNAIHDAIG